MRLGSSIRRLATNTSRQNKPDGSSGWNVIESVEDAPAKRGEPADMTRRAFRCASFALPRAASVPFQCLMQPPSGFVAGRVREKPFGGFADQHVATVERGERLRQATARPAQRCCHHARLRDRARADHGSKNRPAGSTCLNTRAASRSMSAGGRCQHSSQNAVTLAFVGATAVVANKNPPGCASSA